MSPNKVTYYGYHVTLAAQCIMNSRNSYRQGYLCSWKRKVYYKNFTSALAKKAIWPCVVTMVSSL